MGPALLFQPVLATNLVAFFVIFGIFVIAVVTLAVITLKWAFARDKPGRDAWKQRYLDTHAPSNAPTAEGEVPPASES